MGRIRRSKQTDYVADPLCVCLQALLLIMRGGEGIFQSGVFLPQHDGKQRQQQRSEDRRQAPPRPPQAEQPLGLTLRRTFILRDSGHQTCARALRRCWPRGRKRQHCRPATKFA